MRFRILIGTVVCAVGAALLAPAAVADDPGPGDEGALIELDLAADFASPLFGLNPSLRGDRLLVADAGQGIVKLRDDPSRRLAHLQGITDVIQVYRYWYLVTTGEAEPAEAGPLTAEEMVMFRPAPPQRLLWVNVQTGQVAPAANLIRFEKRNNPDGGEIVSNPFDIARVGRSTLVADAGANALIQVGQKRRVDYVATFAPQLADTSDLKDLVGCPNPPDPAAAFACDLPPQIPAEAVPTTVALGPDGHYYVGNLVGFPAPQGMSKIYRIERGTRHAVCSGDNMDGMNGSPCEVVLEGFTSIIDINFGPDGTLYVTEFDEAGWLAAELGLGEGGTINACDVGAGTCTEIATDVPLPTAVAATNDGSVYSTILSLVPGAAGVIQVQ